MLSNITGQKSVVPQKKLNLVFAFDCKGEMND